MDPSKISENKLANYGPQKMPENKLANYEPRQNIRKHGRQNITTHYEPRLRKHAG